MKVAPCPEEARAREASKGACKVPQSWPPPCLLSADGAYHGQAAELRRNVLQPRRLARRLPRMTLFLPTGGRHWRRSAERAQNRRNFHTGLVAFLVRLTDQLMLDDLRTKALRPPSSFGMTMDASLPGGGEHAELGRDMSDDERAGSCCSTESSTASPSIKYGAEGPTRLPQQPRDTASNSQSPQWLKEVQIREGVTSPPCALRVEPVASCSCTQISCSQMQALRRIGQQSEVSRAWRPARAQEGQPLVEQGL